MLKLVEYNSRDYVYVMIDQIEIMQPGQGNTTNIRLLSGRWVWVLESSDKIANMIQEFYSK